MFLSVMNVVMNEQNDKKGLIEDKIRRRKMWGRLEGGRDGVEARWAWWGGSEMSMETPRNVATRSATHWNSDVGKGLRKRCEATNVPDTPMDISQNQTLAHVVRVPDVNTYTLHLGAIRLRKVRRTV